MSFRRLSLLAAALLLTATVVVTSARAQTAVISDFTLKRADNSALTLSSLSGRKAVVVVFSNAACPFSRLYQGRLTELTSAYAGRGVEFLFVTAPINLEQTAETLDTDKLKVKTSGADVAYLTDEGLKTVALLGVTKTPEVVVLQPGSGGFTVRYRGAIDDNPQMEAYAKDHYLKNALDAVLAGQAAAVSEKRASGCLIKKN
ncbi:redoxin domain-containing protein [Hymenobacter sp. 15J16-1T3B]|uniref:redoxin domain-containing protein n=1 Tax=Hymenobacter sp. 15J16-1T3B TaxID=2886941 RepID=UPI001D112714|nr:redoxin domain-containing protein [Hymenobacter sp. 15J16-1T3B]MCC3157235.1 redoxin domain-containing protein [Hymenobacter sp. 15J16-1T3B]